MFTLAYTGYRHTAKQVVWRDLDVVLARKGPFRLLVGFDPGKRTPTGGDLWAYEWALVHPEVELECHPAHWDVPELSKAAGPYRNGYMIGKAQASSEPSGMLAHLHPKSKGAAGAAKFADLVGLHVWKPKW